MHVHVHGASWILCDERQEEWPAFLSIIKVVYKQKVQHFVGGNCVLFRKVWIALGSSNHQQKTWPAFLTVHEVKCK